MKNLFFISFVLLTMLIGFSSCTNEEDMQIKETSLINSQVRSSSSFEEDVLNLQENQVIDAFMEQGNIESTVYDFEDYPDPDSIIDAEPLKFFPNTKKGRKAAAEYALDLLNYAPCIKMYTLEQGYIQVIPC